MKKLLTLIALAGVFSVSLAQTAAAPTTTNTPAPAEAAAAAPTAQQNRMVSCNKEAGAKNLAGDPRKAFMKSCLSGEVRYFLASFFSVSPESAAMTRRRIMSRTPVSSGPPVSDRVCGWGRVAAVLARSR